MSVSRNVSIISLVVCMFIFVVSYSLKNKSVFANDFVVMSVEMTLPLHKLFNNKRLLLNWAIIRKIAAYVLICTHIQLSIKSFCPNRIIFKIFEDVT